MSSSASKAALTPQNSSKVCEYEVIVEKWKRKLRTESEWQQIARQLTLARKLPVLLCHVSVWDEAGKTHSNGVKSDSSEQRVGVNSHTSGYPRFSYFFFLLHSTFIQLLARVFVHFSALPPTSSFWDIRNINAVTLKSSIKRSGWMMNGKRRGKIASTLRAHEMHIQIAQLVNVTRMEKRMKKK